MQKQLNARVLLKHDTTANWEKVHTKFVPLAGEMIIYDDYEPVWETNPDGLTPQFGLNSTLSYLPDGNSNN